MRHSNKRQKIHKKRPEDQRDCYLVLSEFGSLSEGSMWAACRLLGDGRVGEGAYTSLKFPPMQLDNDRDRYRTQLLHAQYMKDSKAAETILAQLCNGSVFPLKSSNP